MENESVGAKVVVKNAMDLIACLVEENDRDYILDNLTLAARYGQLAEEASELTQAALKCQRFLMEENPPEKSADELWKNLSEEFTDVLLCADMTDVQPNADIYCSKVRRWADRLRNREDQ